MLSLTKLINSLVKICLIILSFLLMCFNSSIFRMKVLEEQDNVDTPSKENVVSVIQKAPDFSTDSIVPLYTPQKLERPVLPFEVYYNDDEFTNTNLYGDNILNWFNAFICNGVAGSYAQKYERDRSEFTFDFVNYPVVDELRLNDQLKINYQAVLGNFAHSGSGFFGHNEVLVGFASGIYCAYGQYARNYLMEFYSKEMGMEGPFDYEGTNNVMPYSNTSKYVLYHNYGRACENDCTHSKPWVTNEFITLFDEKAPTITKVYCADDIDGLYPTTSFVNGQRAYVILEFSENIRFSDNTNHSELKLKLKLANINTKQTVDTNTYATFAKLVGNKMVFYYNVNDTVSTSEGSIPTNHYIVGVDLDPLTFNKKTPLKLVYNDGSIDTNVENKNVVCDLAGNSLSSQSIALNDYVYMDITSPYPTEISTRKYYGTTSFITTNDYIDFTVHYDDILVFPTNYLDSDIVAILNYKNSTYPNGIEVPCRFFWYPNGQSRLEFTYQYAVGDEPISLNNEKVDELAIRMIDFKSSYLSRYPEYNENEFKVTDPYGNVLDINQNFFTLGKEVLPKEKYYIDNVYPDVNVLDVKQESGNYKPNYYTSNTNDPNFYFKFNVTDIIPSYTGKDEDSNKKYVSGFIGKTGYLFFKSSYESDFEYCITYDTLEYNGEFKQAKSGSIINGTSGTRIPFALEEGKIIYFQIKLTSTNDYYANKMQVSTMISDNNNNGIQIFTNYDYLLDKVSPEVLAGSTSSEFDNNTETGTLTMNVEIEDPSLVDISSLKYKLSLDEDGLSTIEYKTDFNLDVDTNSQKVTMSIVKTDLPKGVINKLYVIVTGKDIHGNEVISSPLLFTYNTEIESIVTTKPYDYMDC